MGAKDGERPKVEDVLDAVPTTCLVSGGEWTGVPLVELLNRAGLKSGIESVHFVGYDDGRPDPTPQYAATGRTDIDVVDPGIINYDKALPLKKALHPDTLLAWAHNGEYLQHVHGAPLRLVVPGWSGNWSVKWLKEINLLDHTPACYYQTHYFVFGDSPESPDKTPCMELGCKSIILSPIDEDSPLPRGKHLIKGLAWSGAGAVKMVEVSLDNGASWQLRISTTITIAGCGGAGRSCGSPTSRASTASLRGRPTRQTASSRRRLGTFRQSILMASCRSTWKCARSTRGRCFRLPQRTSRSPARS